MSQTVISTAATEYYRRPADERFASPQAMLDAARVRKATSKAVTYNAKDLRILPADDHRIVLQSPTGAQADLSPWSHGQLCRTVGAPAAYVRTLPPAIAADALNYGLQHSAVGTTARVLVQKTDAGLLARSVTSETYGQLWDADLLQPILNTLGGSGWTTPPTWDGTPAGAYAGDRDSFLILCNGGSIVTDPSVRGGNGQMYRALLVTNSEVGAKAVRIERVLYEYVCGNHNLWGAVIDANFRRRHVGDNVLRDVIREIGTIARTWINRPASTDEQLIRQLIDLELAATREGCVDELRKMGASLADAEAAYTTCVEHFDASPRSYWGLSQGLTKASQASGYQDDRLTMDQLAAKLLAKGRSRTTVAA